MPASAPNIAAKNSSSTPPVETPKVRDNGKSENGRRLEATGDKSSDRIKATGSHKAKKPKSKLGRASLLSRGLTRVDEDGEGPLVHMQTDESGVGIFLFQFHHASAQ